MEEIKFVQKAVIKHPEDKNKFLLLIRNSEDESRPGDYDIPGGRVEEGELHEDSLRREVMEEAGIEITDIAPIIVKSRYKKEKNKYFLYIGYKANTNSTDIKISPKEHASYEWITLEKFRAIASDHILMPQIEAAYA